MKQLRHRAKLDPTKTKNEEIDELVPEKKKIKRSEYRPAIMSLFPIRDMDKVARIIRECLVES